MAVGMVKELETQGFIQNAKNLNFDKKDSICIVVNHAMRNTNTNQIREIHGISSVGLEIIKED